MLEERYMTMKARSTTIKADKNSGSSSGFRMFCKASFPALAVLKEIVALFKYMSMDERTLSKRFFKN